MSQNDFEASEETFRFQCENHAYRPLVYSRLLFCFGRVAPLYLDPLCRLAFATWHSTYARDVDQRAEKHWCVRQRAPIA